MDVECYLFDNANDAAATRFSGLQGLWDEHTVQQLVAIGVNEGWSCWEVGAGGGSIARWLADRVGSTGSVLATDLDLRWMPASSLPRLTIACHDVAHDPIPFGTYDLVHARLVLVHVPQRERVLADLARSLRPGGWLVVEDFDAVLQDAWEPLTADDALFRRVHRATQELLVRRGADIRYARRLPQLMRGVGLERVSIEARFALGAAARPGFDAIRANFVQTRAELIAAELVTAEEVDRALDLLDNAEFPVVPLMVSARGQKHT